MSNLKEFEIGKLYKYQADEKLFFVRATDKTAGVVVKSNCDHRQIGYTSIGWKANTFRLVVEEPIKELSFKLLI